MGLRSYSDGGAVEDNLSINSDLNIYYKAKLAQPPIDGTVNETWEDVTLNGERMAKPQDLWGIIANGEKIIITEGAHFDASGLADGKYVLFVWGCETGQLKCGWLKPRVFAVENSGVVVPDNAILSGHRGAGTNGAGLAPENTIMAFETAQEAGLNSVEFDVLPAKDGFVVFHDKNTKAKTGTSYEVASTPVSTLTQLSPVKDYEEKDSEYAVPESEAKTATIPSLDETLDYLQEKDMTLRIEFKGKLKSNSEMAGQVYEKVDSRGLNDQSIFMSFAGKCSTTADVGWHTVNPLNSDSTIVRKCTYPGLEGVEDASHGDATTAILWQKRKDPSKHGLNKALTLPPEWALDRAEENDFDMVVPRVSMPQAYGVHNNGLKGTEMSVDEFIEEAESRGLDYSFMSLGENPGVALEEYGAAWVSTNRPDRLLEKVHQYYEDSGSSDFEGE